MPYIIACDAGPGELPSRASHFIAGRLRRSFEVVHRKNQDGGRARLHEWGAAGRIDGFTLAYLGMQDHRLPAPPADLVPRDNVASYPTNFAAISHANFIALTTRGEQLMRSLLPLYLHQN